jgi:hypothetical protein
MKKPCLLTLVSGGSYAQREVAIATVISATSAAESSAVILEGLPVGNNVLSEQPSLQIHRIAPGCMCCIGNLVLRVTLNRVLQTSPSHIFLSLASQEHLAQLKVFLEAMPYQALLEIQQDLRI